MVSHPKRSKRTSWDIRGSYVAVYDPATKFFREWSVYASHGGASVLLEVRQHLADKVALPVVEIAGVRQKDRAFATQILKQIVDLAENDLAGYYITTKLLTALIAVCKFRPHFLLRKSGKGFAIEHIDVVDEPSEARKVLMQLHPDIGAIAPLTPNPVTAPSMEMHARPKRAVKHGAPIADIYVRVAMQSASADLERQEQTCRDWCLQQGIVARNVIKEIGRPFSDNKQDGRAYRQAFDSWRKAYWDAKGEPLTADECNPAVVPVSPPDLLVIETMDRFCLAGVIKGAITLMLLGSMGIEVKLIEQSNITASGPWSELLG